MNYYSYLIEHDFGLAPNPFGGYCTLTVCKPNIRKSGNLHIGDWIIGTGSRSLEKTFKKPLWHYLIYAMKINDIIPMEDYWNDIRFRSKKPIINGSLQLMYGDNFYYKDDQGIWMQENSAHSNKDGTPNSEHLKADTSGENALISNFFFYFGQAAPFLPPNLHCVCHTTQGQKLLTEEQGENFVNWLTSAFNPGIYGKPINWIIYR